MTIRNHITAFLLLFSYLLSAQVAPKKPTSADIYEGIKRLQTLGSVLYIAAHPDDENTRLIAYMANERRMNTTYLSLTRGDGGQNLIGNELREMLGVLRTQELLMARSVDGGKQLFSRANDFGFSKSPAETMRIWSKNDVLADAVWAIRKTQPDIIINRFSTDTTVDTHGHHTASAVLSQEAFELAADPKAYPEQLKYVRVWQPSRLFFNTSWFFYGSQEKFAAADKSKMLNIDMGVFYPTRGKSNNEIAAESRSMHKCQGFGMLSSRGSEPEYLDFLKGTLPKPDTDPFEGINTTWERIGTSGNDIKKVLAYIEQNFKFDNPAASVPELVNAMRMIEKLPADNHWRNIKLAEIKDIIRWAAGLYLEASTTIASNVAGQELILNIEAINRSKNDITLEKISYIGFDEDTTLNMSLENNRRNTYKKRLTIPLATPFSDPYWLRETATYGMYRVDNQLLRGLPETARPLRVRFDILIGTTPISYEQDIVNRYERPDKGELYRPFEVTPSVFVNISEKVYVFGSNDAKNIEFLVRAGKDKLNGTLRPKVPKGWTISPETLDFNLKIKGEETVLSFQLIPPKDETEGNVSAEVILKEGENKITLAAKSVKFIEYDHIPAQTVLYPATAKILKINILKRGNNIGYVMGAGDEMPEYLEQIGYNVTQITDKDFANVENLKKFDAIVVGIRAYNTKEKLKFNNQKLLDYVAEGGNVIVQYNTAGRDLVLPQFGPYPFKLGRGRTTEEDAPVRFLKPEHSVLNIPNKITEKDFDGWVQERGLYFLSEWDNNYEAVLSCNDVGEKAENGGLVVAKHGKGYYIYTGYSFFRQLPAGVSGAYRLFANLISIGKQVP